MSAPGTRGRFSIPRYALDHPHATIVFAFLMVALGVYAYLTIPVRMIPKIPAPNIGVVTQFSGMTASEIDRYITRPLEKRIQIVGGVNYMLGTSQNGYSKIVVYFRYDVDLAKKWREMQALLNTLTNELPKAGPNVTVPRLVHVNQQNGPILEFAVTRKGMNQTALKEMLDNVLLTQFQLIHGVLSAYIFGGPTRQIQVVLNRNKLAAYGVSILGIRHAIDASDVSQGVGPVSSGARRITVKVPNEFTSKDILRRLRNLPIGSHDSRIVYLRDVARIEDTHAQLYGDFFYDGKPAILLAVQAESDGNFLKIAHDTKRLAKLMEQAYPGLKFRVAFDKTFYIHLNDSNAMDEFIKAVVLAGLVIFLFLGEFGGTIIAAAILPSAIAFGFFLIYLMGYQRDFGIMLGLVFVVGKLLDDSIVVVEMIRREIERGGDVRTACIRGTEKVQKAIAAATFTFVVMLIPMIRLTGDMGSGFRSMTLPMITSVIGSLLLALTLTPLMASHLFQPKPRAGGAADAEPSLEEEMEISSQPPPGRVGGVIYVLFLRHFHGFERWFMRVVGWSIDHKWIVVAGIAGSIWMSYGIFATLGVEQMPLTDTSLMLGYLRAEPGTSAKRMRSIVKEVTKIARKNKNVESVSVLTGESPVWGDFFNGYGVNRVNEAQLIVPLTIAREQRKETLWQIEKPIVREAKRKIPDLQVLFFQPLNPTPVVAARAPVEILVKGLNMKRVYSYARQVLDMAPTADPALDNPYLDTVDGVPQLSIDVDEARTRAMGLTVQNVIGQVYYALNGGKTLRFFNPAPMYYHSRILIRYQAGQRATPQDVADLMIATPSGREVPLKAIARIRRTVGFDRIHTYDTLYAASILGYYQQLGLKETTLDLLLPAKMQLSLPKGYAVGPAGLMSTLLQAFNQLDMGLKVALIAVFLLLVVQFRSFGIALVLMLAIPLEGLGSLGALALRGMDWSPPVLWGMVILAGIVLSNSILIIDRILYLRERGAERTRAIVVASTQRLRPVLMTAIAAGIAMAPVALYPPPATEQFRNIATGIIGGLLTSTVMTLVAIPVAYALMDDLVGWLRRFYMDERFDVRGTTADGAQDDAGGRD